MPSFFASGPDQTPAVTRCRAAIDHTLVGNDSGHGAAVPPKIGNIRHDVASALLLKVRGQILHIASGIGDTRPWPGRRAANFRSLAKTGS